jgi:superfamily II DNA or RNA helicase
MSIQLHEFQAGGIEGLRAGFAEGHRAQILYGPTGMGKTEVAMAMMKAAHDKGTRAAIILDRKVLCDQTSTRLDKYGIPHGVDASGHWRHRPYERIQVCMAQTLEARGTFPDINLLFVDECHNTRTQTAEMIRSRPDLKIVGLTATPFTKGLGSLYTNVVTCTTTEFLVQNGFLVPLRVFQATQIDMTGAKKVAGEWSKDDATERGIKITGDVVTEWVAKTHAIFGGPRKTIVFCAGVAHGEDLSRKFSEAGYNFVSISHNDDDEFKREAVAEFSKPDSTIHGLIATDILTKGFDVPDVMIGVSARPFSKSLSSHVQQLGRVIRRHPGKEFALWLDHSGNYLRFQEDWEQVYAEGPGALDDGREKAKPEPTEREKKAAVCPKCASIFPASQDVCVCGYTRMRHNGVVVLPGELQEIAKRERAAQGDRQRFYSELIHIAESRGYKPGWAFHKFKERFGNEPRGLRAEPQTVSFDTLKWIQSQQIRWAKSRSRVAA